MTEEQDKIVRFDEHSHSFNLPDTDFKAEVVASGLKEGGYDAERTLISGGATCVAASRRTSRKYARNTPITT